MGKTEKSFQDEIKIMAEITEKIDELDFLSEEEVNIKIELPKEKFSYILNHFREVDRSNNEFNIKIDKVNFNFVLKM
jgi:hypothetical protein